VDAGRAAGGVGLPEGWTHEYLPRAVPPQLRRLRNPDGSVNREAFVILRGTANLAPYSSTPEGEEHHPMHENTEPAPEPDPTPPPDE
jgi:hypothetical protein